MHTPGWGSGGLIALLVLHGAIHLLGVARAFGWGEVPLQKVMGPGEGLLWGAAALLFVSAALALWLAPRWWWAPALLGVVLSQALIVGAWGDARWGTLANVVIVVPALLAAADLRPGSLGTRYRAEVARVQARAASASPGDVVTEADLEALPAPVARWMRRIGVVGRPRPGTLQATYRIRIRGSADEGWMAGQGEQFTRIEPPVRLFYMTARKAGLLDSGPRWRTPFSAYGTFDGVRLPRSGQGWWGTGESAWPYVEIEVRGVTYDPDPRRRGAP